MLLFLKKKVTEENFDKFHIYYFVVNMKCFTFDPKMWRSEEHLVPKLCLGTREKFKSGKKVSLRKKGYLEKWEQKLQDVKH